MDKKKKGIIDYIEFCCLIISGVSVTLLMLMTTLDVVLRYCFQSPISGMLEFSEEYLMIGSIYLPLSYVYTHGGHIKIELLERFFSPRLKKYTEKINTVISLVFFLLIVAASLPIVEDAIRVGEESRSAMHYPMAPAYAMVTIGCLLVCLRAIESFMGKGPLHEEHLSE